MLHDGVNEVLEQILTQGGVVREESGVLVLEGLGEPGSFESGRRNPRGLLRRLETAVSRAALEAALARADFVTGVGPDRTFWTRANPDLSVRFAQTSRHRWELAFVLHLDQTLPSDTTIHVDRTLHAPLDVGDLILDRVIRGHTSDLEALSKCLQSPGTREPLLAWLGLPSATITTLEARATVHWPDVAVDDIVASGATLANSLS
jgi:hypothetical protein